MRYWLLSGGYNCNRLFSTDQIPGSLYLYHSYDHSLYFNYWRPHNICSFGCRPSLLVTSVAYAVCVLLSVVLAIAVVLSSVHHTY